MSDNYCYQKFFNLTETDSIELKKVHYKKSSLFPLVNFTYRRELFDDSNSKLTRSIKASWLDSHIDTESDFDVLLDQISEVGTIVIINDREKCNNPIYKAYSSEMLKSYFKAFQEKGYQCLWTE